MTLRPPNVRKWANSPNLDMLLLWASALEELLFDYTIDSYKASALNLHTTIYELHFLASQARRDRTRVGALVPVLSEFEWRLAADPVLTPQDRRRFAHYASRLREVRGTPRLLIPYLDALLVEFQGFYWERLRKAIPEAVTAPKNSRKVLALANAFVAEAELQGFSRSYVFHSARLFFWNRPIATASAIDAYLQLFDAGTKDYTFHFRASHGFLDLTQFSAPLRITVAATPPTTPTPTARTAAYLGTNDAFPLYVTIANVKARDQLSARHRAETQVEALADVYSLHVHQSPLAWQRRCLCVEPDGRQSILNAPVSPMRRSVHSTVADKAQDIANTIDVLAGRHFTRADTIVFHKAFDYHRAALEAVTAENQLLDLWSALEGFLPPPSGDMDRITHYVNAVMPALSLTYAHKLFAYAADAIGRAGAAAVAVVNAEAPGATWYDRVVCILTCGDMEPALKKLLIALGRQPLLRFRCFDLHTRFNSARRVRRAVADHRERVSWHLQRIYQTRNSIAHNAEALPYLDTLVENLHAYLDTLIRTIVRVGVSAQRTTTIESVVRLLSAHEQVYLAELEDSSAACTVSNHREVLFGAANPATGQRGRFIL